VSDVVKQIESTTKGVTILVFLVAEDAKKTDKNTLFHQEKDWRTERGRVVYKAAVKGVPYALQLDAIGVEGLSGTATIGHRLLSERGASIDAIYKGYETHARTFVSKGRDAYSVSAGFEEENMKLLVVVVNFQVVVAQ
jgi:hypothetical protein